MQRELALGKTAVLVERIINKIIKENVDIDRLLVVTFTNAAASEMRERIAERLYKEAENNHVLQNQIKKLSKASITTIDSFCLRVVRDYFFKIDLDPNFRIGENSESELLKMEALDELLENKYDSESDEFDNVFNIYTSNKSDDNLKSLILNIYKHIKNYTNPKQWIEEKISYFDDASIFTKYVLDYSKEEISNSINELEVLYDDISSSDLAGKYIDVIWQDIVGLKYLLSKCNDWDELYSAINNFEFARANGARGVPDELKEQINEVRESAKSTINDDLKKKYFILSLEEIKEDNEIIKNNLKAISKLIFEFEDLYKEKKFERNILDFSDVAHYALELLSDKDIANYYREQFEEILIDEYQDSNLIQETILNSISKNNIFMVGDVKQSIYRFRGGKPELFLSKYESYNHVSSEEKNYELTAPSKILLFKNFRSNQNIINQTNFIFENIMSKELGELDYNEEEFLKFGADYYLNEGTDAELCLIESQIDEDDVDEDVLYETNGNIEGRFIARKIKSMVGKTEVYDKKLGANRPATYKDFAILLRNTVGRRDAFLEELSNAGIPAYTDASGEYFENTEVQTILSLLRIIDNPIQDIPLVAVLRSQIGNFSINELSRIRLCDKKCPFYEALIKSLNMEDELSLKVKIFLDKLNLWREKSKYLTLWELLLDIYNVTGYYDYVSLFPDGVKRVSNLKLLLERAEKYEKTSFKGLFSFLNYIDNIKASSGDLGDSKIIGENENVVRIMSIHKSKGLEFPIVFVSGTDKEFNDLAMYEDIVLDDDLGFGMDMIDYDVKIKYANISKHAISIKQKKENRSEEMRILYVALTRAREKLFVTGVVKNIEKAKQKYKSTISKYKLYNAISYVDWLGYLIVGSNNCGWKLKEILRSELLPNNDNKELSNNDEHKDDKVKDSEILQKIDNQMNWQYVNLNATTLPNKISISEIKRRFYNDEDTNLLPKLISAPEFISSKNDEGTNYGTLVHSVLEKIDFKNYSTIDLEGIIKNFTDDKYLINSIAKKINEFSKSALFNDIKLAQSIHKETAFNLNLKASEVFEIDSDNDVMIQGIIDLYYVNQNNEIVLVDYKTDNVENENDLMNRYRIQLDLYKKALEDILGMKVSKTIIFSFKLMREIEL